ncbi:hypothetical protein GOV03_05110 [Candidatus Woesearchaeota archaeon]|nr:hypothetical protein [Candidatus Woesearchaeota archaeon]
MKKRGRGKEKVTKLIKFAERAKGLEIGDKIKLILFLTGVKPNGEIILKVDSKNLGEKFDFEKKLKEEQIIFSASKARSYEEIKKIKGNQVIWEIKGTYFIYDLFGSKKDKEVFNKYLSLLNKGKYNQGDLVGGKHYGYPLSCVKKFIKEKDENFLKKKYTYWNYYKKQQDLDRKFPFIFHRACSLKCKDSIRMNQKYSEALKKVSKKVYKEYLSRSKFKGGLIVGGISDVEIKGKSIWPKKEGYEYELIFKKPFRKHYFLVSFLSRKKYELGQVLKGEVALRYDYAKVRISRKKRKVIKELYHKRKLPLLGEVTVQTGTL